jgi:N-acetyl-alpha-D-muramate 1-phosphate uridylyltransferase
MKPDTAVILAAGLGTRMRPLSATTPKPLLPLAGRPIAAHLLDRLRGFGITRVVVNTHHLRDAIAEFAAPHAEITLRDEENLLDTGGAIAAMLADGLLGAEPFLVLNGDTFWLDGPANTLARLTAGFDPACADCRLLLARAAGASGETGMGDFLWPREGALRRRGERDVAPYLYAGAQIVSPALFADAPDAPFSFNALWDRALAAERLEAIVHDGIWCSLSTPEDLRHAEAMMVARAVGNTT